MKGEYYVIAKKVLALEYTKKDGEKGIEYAFIVETLEEHSQVLKLSISHNQYTHLINYDIVNIEFLVNIRLQGFEYFKADGEPFYTHRFKLINYAPSRELRESIVNNLPPAENVFGKEYKTLDDVIDLAKVLKNAVEKLETSEAEKSLIRKSIIETLT